MAAGLGFEPRRPGSEPGRLPLPHPAIDRGLGPHPFHSFLRLWPGDLAVSGLAASNHFRASLGPVAVYRYLIRQKKKTRLARELRRTGAILANRLTSENDFIRLPGFLGRPGRPGSLDGWSSRGHIPRR